MLGLIRTCITRADAATAGKMDQRRQRGKETGHGHHGRDFACGAWSADVRDNRFRQEIHKRKPRCRQQRARTRAACAKEQELRQQHGLAALDSPGDERKNPEFLQSQEPPCGARNQHIRSRVGGNQGDSIGERDGAGTAGAGLDTAVADVARRYVSDHVDRTSA